MVVLDMFFLYSFLSSFPALDTNCIHFIGVGTQGSDIIWTKTWTLAKSVSFVFCHSLSFYPESMLPYTANIYHINFLL